LDFRPLENCLTASLPHEASRLFHGRGQCYPGLSFLNVDWFEPLVWAVLYGEVEEDTVQQVTQQLLRLAEVEERVRCVSLQRRVKGRATQQVIYGEVPAECYALEAGARYELNFSANQNIGFFLDARPGRDWLRQRAAGKRVLNLFSYTCSFSVAALQGGADKVVNIDMAKSSLATGQRNHALNALEVAKASFLPHDIFRSTRKLEKLGPYDLVVIDPPSRQKRSFEANKDYTRLLGKLPPMLAEGASILACLNAPYLDDQFLPVAFAAQLPGFELQQRLPQRPDFPEADLNRCLKMQVFA
jgi:23S rRNA (cytosine1962-C5)-methyltransferase